MHEYIVSVTRGL